MHLLIGIAALLVAGILVHISHIFIPLALAITLYVAAKAIKHCDNCSSWMTGWQSDDETKNLKGPTNNRMRD